MDQIFNLSEKIYTVLDDKKAHEIVVLSVKGINPIADYFIICTGTSSTHINALSDYVEKEMAKEGIKIKHKEGKQQGGWLLLDYRDIVVHIFNSETRDYYSLERIWNDAKRVNFA
ncbi:ribosome silencing factor [Fusibacter bizertensis]|uniref:Ribosomal silencing factor RsfS n=1 Tax=Fusibacter bizertensis TaxID=1488331 RepID=A0ABT6ND83_9FIRM|nr:ribosome silencing factor [Fusibacter bizertensis]MDH8678373.1 ribosome silencing factor [Fusibacter bizertensis]